MAHGLTSEQARLNRRFMNVIRVILGFELLYPLACGGSEFSVKDTTTRIDSDSGSVDSAMVPRVHEVTYDARINSEDSGQRNPVVFDAGASVADSGIPLEVGAPDTSPPEPVEYCPLHTAFNDKCSSGLAHWPCNYTPPGCVGSSTGAIEVRCCK